MSFKKLPIGAFLVTFLFIMFSQFSFSQQNQTEITEGREYWLGIPFCKMLQPEAIRGEFPIALWISSKMNTQATVTDIETGMNKTVTINANKITQVVLSDNLMNRESEVIKNYGIHVISKDPISVAVYLSYRWSGEAYRVIPVEWLGKKYYSANLYQDETDEIKPGQILVIATADNTVLKYRPTYASVKVNAGNLTSVTLNKGQTFLILARNAKGLSQDWSTDMSGTYIEASKPVAVISGHTKGAFPRYYIGMRSGWMEPYANFSRNMLCDMLWPVELWGNEYVSAPLRYLNRPRGLTIVQDDGGDLIRFVSGFDGTEIYQMRQDGSSLMKIGKTLKRGEWYNITNQEVAAYYKSNKPILAVQYGKTWWLDNGMMGPIAKKDKDHQLNPYGNGQGMMVVLAPINHWCSYANFRSPDAMDNFVYVTFREKDRTKLKFDGQLFTTKWGSSIKPINGTEYVYITEVVSFGDHYIEAIDSAVFAGYAYGNWDREKDGFAYGYPIGINYVIPCTDSLFIKDALDCGNVTGQGFSVPDTSECAGIFAVSCNEDSTVFYNYIFKVDDKFENGDKTVSYSLNIIDYRKPAKAIVTVVTRSGKSMSRTYQYIPEEITVNPTFINYGMLKVGQTVCKVFQIENTGTVPVTVKKLWLKGNSQEYSITTKDLPVTLQPGEKKEIEVCATALVLSNSAVKDSVMAQLSCYSRSIVGLEFTTGEPIVTISDAHWSQMAVGNEEPRTVKISNISNSVVELYSMDWDDKLHFTKVEGLPFPAPLILQPNTDFDFTVYYKPDKSKVQDSTRAIFVGNTVKKKLYSDWIGIGAEPGPRIVGWDWGNRRVIDTWAINHGVTEYPHQITIANDGDTTIKVNDITIVNDPSGVFRIDRNMIPGELKPKESVNIDAFFAPKAEVSYISQANLICRFNNKDTIKTDDLKGVGMQPHIGLSGIVYPEPLIVGNSKDSFALVWHVTNKNPMLLTILKIYITGQDMNSFVIDPVWLADKTQWETIPINGQLKVPVKFTANHAGDHTAQINVESDAPENPVGDLLGKGYLEGISSNDHDHGTLFVSQSNTGLVFLTNTGSVSATINRDIDKSVSTVVGDAGTFIINGWKTAKTGLINPIAPFDLNPNDTLWVDVTFKPMTDKMIVVNDPLETRSYQARIDYQTSIGNAVSSLTGKATVIRVIASIPAGVYKTDPGKQIEISYYLNKHPQETKQLSQANIKDWTADIIFKSTGRQNIQDIFPVQRDNNDKTPFGCKDIIKDNSISLNWTCIKADTTNGGTTLRVRMTGNDAINLSGNTSILFSVKMNTYLSDLDLIPLPVTFNVESSATPYTIIDVVPGDIKINPVCVNTLRLIKLSGVQYSLAAAAPNPSGASTRINYSVGLEGQTRIELYNGNGEKVATLLNEPLKPGDYELMVDFNALNLSSGVYTYRMESGMYQSEPKQIIIVK